MLEDVQVEQLFWQGRQEIELLKNPAGQEGRQLFKCRNPLSQDKQDERLLLRQL